MNTELTVLVLTHIDQDTKMVKQPHLIHLMKANPAADVKLVAGPDSPLGKVDNWRNGDRPLRNWWRERGHTVTSSTIAVIEWDTLVLAPIPELPAGIDLASATCIKHRVGDPLTRPKRMSDPRWTPSSWWWWSDIHHLPLSAGDTAIGLVSFGFYLMRREVLDLVADEKWDEPYEKSVQNEIRFPTIAGLGGFEVGEISLPDVHHRQTNFTGKPGIYHPVKQPVSFP